MSATVTRRSTPASIRVWEAQVVTVWRAWKSSALLSMLQPLVFLGGMGFGVGALVDERSGSTAALGGLGYLAFLGPALMATTAMQTATFEASYPVMDGFKWRRAFEAMTDLEKPVQARLLERLAAHPKVRLVGPASPAVEDRVATVSFLHESRDPREIVAAAHAAGVGIRHGHMYAHRLCTAMGIEPEPGVVRVSAVHYNTVEEIDHLMDALDPVLG